MQYHYSSNNKSRKSTSISDRCKKENKKILDNVGKTRLFGKSK